jgi:hypothetical protein
MTVLAWGAKLKPEEREKVRNIAANIGASPSHLMACMAFETGRSFAPWCRNPGSSATGLIQFMESTAQGLGTSTAALAGMTVLQQLDYVWEYFKPYRGRLGALADVYMAILYPAAVGQADDYPVFKDGSAAYAANKALDINHDGVVTKAECAAFVDKMLAEGLEPGNRSFEPIATQEPAPIEDHSPVDLPPVQPQEESMPIPLIAAGILQAIATWGPTIASMIPQVASVFDKDKQSPARLDAAVAVVNKIVEVTGSVNTEAAVAAITSSQETLEKVRQAVVTAPEIMPFLVVEVGGGLEKARESNLAVQNADKPFWMNPAFWFVLTAVVPPLYGVVGVLLWRMPDPSEQLVTQVVTGILGLAAVAGAYYLGSTQGSAQKTAIIANQATKQ